MQNSNALKHGCCAVENFLLPTEKLEDFRRLEKTMRAAYETPDEWSADLLNYAIQSEWLHRRATKTYLEVEAALYKTTPSPADWTDEQHKKLARFLRYKARHANELRAYLKQLESYKKAQKITEKRDKSEQIAYLEALSHHGLVTVEDLEPLFGNRSPVTPQKTSWPSSGIAPVLRSE